VRLAALRALSMRTQNDIAGLIVLLAPVGLIYSWYFYLAKIQKEPASWRNRISLLSLVLVSLGVLLWPVMTLLAPRADWTTYVGVPEQIQWTESWQKPIVRTLLGAFLLSVFGRPRLIAPIAVACVGTVLFWIFSSMN
jgi:hypothetical protein